MAIVSNHRGLNLYGLGQFAILGAALSYGFAGIYGRRFREVPPSVAASGQVTCTALVMLPIALIKEQPWIATPSLLTWGALLGLGLLSTAIAYRKFGSKTVNLSMEVAPHARLQNRT